MTPTPEQNAKRETPRTDALLAASAGFTDAEQRDILKVGLQQLETELQQLRLAADGMAKERNELSRSIEEAHHVAMIDWPGSEVPLLSQVESLFSALKEHYNDKIEALRTVADGLRDSLVECRKDSLFIHARNPQFEEPAKRHAQATAALEAYRAAGEGNQSGRVA